MAVIPPKDINNAVLANTATINVQDNTAPKAIVSSTTIQIPCVLFHMRLHFGLCTPVCLSQYYQTVMFNV